MAIGVGGCNFELIALKLLRRPRSDPVAFLGLPTGLGETAASFWCCCRHPLGSLESSSPLFLLPRGRRARQLSGPPCPQKILARAFYGLKGFTTNHYKEYEVQNLGEVTGLQQSITIVVLGSTSYQVV